MLRTGILPKFEKCLIHLQMNNTKHLLFVHFVIKAIVVY